MVKISVIIPVYNTEEYLRQCLDSLVNQTFTDIEIICVDDGSTDNSSNVLKEYEKADSRFKIISQENRGIASARNEGLEHVSGDYIYFIDSDDYLVETGLEVMYNLSNEMNLDLLIFKLMNFDDTTGERNYNYSNMPFLLDIGKNTFTYHDFKEDIFKVDVTIYTKFFKRELIMNDRFCDGLIFEDNAFYFDYIFDAERIHFLDECLLCRRIRNDSTISNANENHADIIEIYRIIKQKFHERKLYDEFKEELFMRKIDSIYYRFTTINPAFRNLYFDLMKKDFSDEKHEYDNVYDLNGINDYTKRVYNAVLKSENYTEIKSYLKDEKQNDNVLTSILKKFKRK